MSGSGSRPSRSIETECIKVIEEAAGGRICDGTIYDAIIGRVR